MRIKRLLYSDKSESFKKRAKLVATTAGLGGGIGLGLGALSKNKKTAIAGGLLGAGLGAGLIAKDPNKYKSESKIDKDKLYTPEINRIISELPKEYKILSKLNDPKLKSLIPDREADEFIYLYPTDEEEIRNLISQGETDIAIFDIWGMESIIEYNIDSKKMRFIYDYKNNKYLNNSREFKKFIIDTLDKDNKRLKDWINKGEEFEDILEFQEYYKKVLMRVL